RHSLGPARRSRRVIDIGQVPRAYSALRLFLTLSAALFPLPPQTHHPHRTPLPSARRPHSLQPPFFRQHDSHLRVPPHPPAPPPPAPAPPRSATTLLRSSSPRSPPPSLPVSAHTSPAAALNHHGQTGRSHIQIPATAPRPDSR